jgi:hypothetical protein
MWISEAELDGLKTYTNVRQVLRRAFSAVR